MVITASRELLAMIRAPRSVDLVGADLVEVPPACGHAQVTAIATSRVAYVVLSAMNAGPAR
ncbi:arginase family protein [Nonomuraea turcica]|uniref:arginase family protein n=1 Tax=Nonomuraea sp. G32 TaxID=3067274 RepID=UPI00273BA506|nr:arginase family protein [Nonomuraea sp. G32]MDP4505799.1 arginase family protein [Nonomuraea sp. G32]